MAPDGPLIWLRTEVKTQPFSADARLEAGLLLRRLQRGERLGLPQARSMSRIGRRCVELRSPDGEHTGRIICRVDPDAVIVAEVFSRKTQQIPQPVIESSRLRLREYDRVVGGSMDRETRKRLEEAGWAVGSAADFLDLTADEAAFVELKLALSEELRTRREDKGLSQAALARKLGSSQSRVAKMEASDPSVSVDLLIRGLLAVGAPRRDIASAIAPKPASRRRSTAAKLRYQGHFDELRGRFDP